MIGVGANLAYEPNIYVLRTSDYAEINYAEVESFDPITTIFTGDDE